MADSAGDKRGPATPLRFAQAAVLFVTLMAGFDVAPAATGPGRGPIVAGDQRFNADSGADPAIAGRLLIGELNCTACHAAKDSLAAWISAKPAPVLNAVSVRVKPDYLRRFLANPQAADPGTTMPDLVSHMDEATRREQIEALVQYLASGGVVREQPSDAVAGERGDQLYHRIGCAVCHGSRGKQARVLATSVPLGDLGEKYAIPGLAAFLKEPHAVRPGGRMPNLSLDERQALDIAHFLIPDANPDPTPSRVAYRVYEGGYGNLPDFETLDPIAAGQSSDFDTEITGDRENVAIAFEGFLRIERPGDYRFWLGSDDSVRFWVNDRVVVEYDAQVQAIFRAFNTVEAATTLRPGVYPLRLEYTHGGGSRKLEVEFEGPGVPRQPVSHAVSLTRDAAQSSASGPETKGAIDGFRLDPSIVEHGRELFASLGCVNCHRRHDTDAAAASMRTGPPSAALVPEKGCLAASPAAPAVSYGLTDRQRHLIATALPNVPSAPPSDADRIDAALVRFNCYGCHERSAKGGVEPERNDLFTTTIIEMGDEGRIPPHLTGVGDKLTAEWLKHLLGNGAMDRPYMQTRMPNFGSENVGFLAEAFSAADARSEVTVPKLDMPEHRIESVGRQLVGESALSCIKCHDFGKHAGTGIRAIDLQTMTRRLRQDWFFRYMPDPQEYRRGTRMPSAFNNGKLAVRDVLGGDADSQLAAIWNFLSLGAEAPVPAGVVHSAIVLSPTDRPIVYRNFIEGVSPRAIAVGYPEKANLAFDADELCLALIWHGAFIDAAKHRVGRGDGYQKPLGDHVVSLVRGVPFAVLADDTAPWPKAPATDQGWQFRGYTTDEQKRPQFRYGTNSFVVEDVAQAIAGGGEDATFRRKLLVTPLSQKSLPERLYFRVAAGQKIDELGTDSFRADGLSVRLLTSPVVHSPLIRDAAEGKELLVPLPAAHGPARVEIEYEW